MYMIQFILLQNIPGNGSGIITYLISYIWISYKIISFQSFPLALMSHIITSYHNSYTISLAQCLCLCFFLGGSICLHLHCECVCFSVSSWTPPPPQTSLGFYPSAFWGPPWSRELQACSGSSPNSHKHTTKVHTRPYLNNCDLTW